MENIVITGATGFLGSNLARRFLDGGYRVWAIVRPGSKNYEALPKHENLNIVWCDMSKILTCVEQIGAANAWFHFAWGGVNRDEIDSKEVQDQNIVCSLDCIKAAYLLQCKVFMDAGSRVEYGITDGKMKEDLECNPVNQYGKAKLEFFQKAKSMCTEYGLRYCHLRFFSVYGYGDHPWSIISTLVKELRNGNSVPLSACRHEWNFMYIDDAIEAVYLLHVYTKGRESGFTTAVNIASKDTRVLKLFVEEVREITGGTGSLEYGTFVQAKEGALSVRPDTQKLSELTGGWTEAYTFRQGILEMIKKEVKQSHEKN